MMNADDANDPMRSMDNRLLREFREACTQEA
jgi:hypothetical protein